MRQEIAKVSRKIEGAERSQREAGLWGGKQMYYVAAGERKK